MLIFVTSQGMNWRRDRVHLNIFLYKDDEVIWFHFDLSIFERLLLFFIISMR